MPPDFGCPLTLDARGRRPVRPPTPLHATATQTSDTSENESHSGSCFSQIFDSGSGSEKMQNLVGFDSGSADPWLPLTVHIPKSAERCKRSSAMAIRAAGASAELRQSNRTD